MPRSLRYYIPETEENRIENAEWAEISALQHWYNSEFIWSCDKIGLKRYILFPNYDVLPEMPYKTARFHFRKRLLAKKIELGDWIEAVQAMVQEGLFHVRWGGVRENSIASGITHVADNEYNAYLLCEFLLKCSTISAGATFHVEDEGRFVLPGRAMFRNGEILIYREDFYAKDETELLDIPQVFSVVDHTKYDNHPQFAQSLEDFDDMDQSEITEAVGSYRNLGFGVNYDTAWGDNEGLNLQQRAQKISMV